MLDQGRVVERGSHDELHAASGQYRRLFDAQHSRLRRPALAIDECAIASRRCGRYPTIPRCSRNCCAASRRRAISIVRPTIGAATPTLSCRSSRGCGLHDFRRRKNSILDSFGATDPVPACTVDWSLPLLHWLAGFARRRESSGAWRVRCATSIERIVARVATAAIFVRSYGDLFSRAGRKEIRTSWHRSRRARHRPRRQSRRSGGRSAARCGLGFSLIARRCSAMRLSQIDFDAR